jgi:hypothetical protein
MKYSSRYVHKISPKPTDVGPEVSLTEKDTRDRKALGKALREQRVLSRGERIQQYRVEPGGVVIFPEASIWHAIVLETPRYQRRQAAGQRRFKSESRYRRFLLHHGEHSYLPGESLSQLRSRALQTRHKRTR